MRRWSPTANMRARRIDRCAERSDDGAAAGGGLRAAQDAGSGADGDAVAAGRRRASRSCASALRSAASIFLDFVHEISYKPHRPDQVPGPVLALVLCEQLITLPPLLQFSDCPICVFCIYTLSVKATHVLFPRRACPATDRAGATHQRARATVKQAPRRALQAPSACLSPRPPP